MSQNKAVGEVKKVRGAKRPSHQLVPIKVQDNLYRVHTRYTFTIALPKYFYLCLHNMVITEGDREIAKGFFERSLQGIFKVVPRGAVIEKVRVNFTSSLIEVCILMEDTLYNVHHFKRLYRTVYESYCSMRDEFIRPRWIDYIEQNNIKYRIQRRRYND